jgi:transcriptional regulator with XRE-family HTH domain
VIDKARFAGRLKELREAAGLSRAELADKAGLKIGGIRDIEQGLRMPYFDTVIALAEALGVDCLAFLQEPSTPFAEAQRGRPAKANADAEPVTKRPRGRPKKDAGEERPKGRKGNQK